MKRVMLCLVVLGMVTILPACGKSPTEVGCVITIDPTSATLLVGQSKVFTAGGGDGAYQFTLTDPTTSAAYLTVNGPRTATVTVTNFFQKGVLLTATGTCGPSAQYSATAQISIGS